MIAIGIDLGTTYSAVATVSESGRPEIVKTPDGDSTTPSVVYFPESGEPLVGREAKEMQSLGESDAAAFFKREMGNASFFFECRGHRHSATDLSAVVLKRLKADAEETLGKTINAAVITVPAYFNNEQRNATIEAGRLAGLEVLQIVNEPTAAAIAYGMTSSQAMNRTTLVYDLGGGTFDVSIVKVTPEEIKVLATDGNHRLGGKDWDDRVADFIAHKFQDEFGVSPFEDAETFNDVLVRCEKAKRELSSRESTRVTVTYAGSQGKYELTRGEFARLTQDLLESTRGLSESVLAAAGLSWGTLDGVLLVGGSTRMPMVADFVRQMTGREPLRGINVDEAVALGAAMKAASLLKEDDSFELEGVSDEFQLPTIADVTSHSLGMVAENEDRSKYVNSFIIPKNARIPAVQTKAHALRVPRSGGELEVYMLQGESKVPQECTVLGKYVFSDVRPGSGGMATIDVSYSYNANGTVDVSAVQRETGQGLPLRVETVPEDMSWLSRSPLENNPPQQSSSASIVLAVDISGSMDGHPLDEAVRAAHALAEKLDLSRFSVGVLAFSDRSESLLSCSSDKRKINAGIEQLKRAYGDWGAGTSAVPFNLAMQMLSKEPGAKYIVLLTDGCWASPSKAISQAHGAKEAGIEIVAIGFGGADRKFLARVATCDENALMTDVSGLVDSFSKIAQVLSDSPMSPLAGTASQGSSGRGFFRNMFG